uniref:Uncharacterized protein n=1 Tax=Methylophaga nitratireducenticrescens TaxID=754476 RepID=I1XG39_METNJ
MNPLTILSHRVNWIPISFVLTQPQLFIAFFHHLFGEH